MKCDKIGHMKKFGISILLLSLTLSGCSLFGAQKIESFKIVLTPQEVPGDLLEASIDFKAHLKSSMLKKGYDLQNIEVTVSTMNKDAAPLVISQDVDMAFLPFLNYVDVKDEGVNYFLSTSLPQLDLGTTDISVYNALQDNNQTLVEAPYRYAAIYTGPSEYGQKLQAMQDKGLAITWIDINQAKWCHVVVSSLDGYIYPSLWMIDTYERRMGELYDHTLTVKGYPDVLSMLADESCDVATGPITLRQTYQNAWTSAKDEVGYGRTQSIYDEVKVLALTQKIYDDVFVLRTPQATEEEWMDEDFILALKESFLELANTPEISVKLFDLLGFSGLVEIDPLEYDTAIPALEYIQRIMN